MKALSRAEVMAIGGYNNFLRTKLPPEHRIFDPDEETLDSAMATFLTAFPRGFAIEVLDVYSGPPKIAFKFRHWGYMHGGPLQGPPAARPARRVRRRLHLPCELSCSFSMPASIGASAF